MFTDLPNKKDETARKSFLNLNLKSVLEAKTEVKTLTDDSATEFAKVQPRNHQFFLCRNQYFSSYFSKLKTVFFKVDYRIFQNLLTYFSKFIIVFFKVYCRNIQNK